MTSQFYPLLIIHFSFCSYTNPLVICSSSLLKIDQLSVIFLIKPPFSLAIFQPAFYKIPQDWGKPAAFLLSSVAAPRDLPELCIADVPPVGDRWTFQPDLLVEATRFVSEGEPKKVKPVYSHNMVSIWAHFYMVSKPIYILMQAFTYLWFQSPFIFLEKLTEFRLGRLGFQFATSSTPFLYFSW